MLIFGVSVHYVNLKIDLDLFLGQISSWAVPFFFKITFHHFFEKKVNRVKNIFFTCFLWGLIRSFKEWESEISFKFNLISLTILN